MARDYLAIPAAGVGVERLFNVGRDICTFRRYSLKPKTIRMLMMMMCLDKFEMKEEFRLADQRRQEDEANDLDLEEISSESDFHGDTPYAEEDDESGNEFTHLISDTAELSDDEGRPCRVIQLQPGRRAPVSTLESQAYGPHERRQPLFRSSDEEDIDEDQRLAMEEQESGVEEELEMQEQEQGQGQERGQRKEQEPETQEQALPPITRSGNRPVGLHTAMGSSIEKKQGRTVALLEKMSNKKAGR